MNKASFVWQDIDWVIPNPKNPRKNPGVKSAEIQEIISSKGWEEGITAYKKGPFYVIISGHRRWYAAKQMGQTEIPIYEVSPPKDDREELERLGSIQGGQVDWTPYEWCEYTYHMYESLGRPSYSSLGKKFNVSHHLIGARIRVYQYYPENEINTKLENNMYSVTLLDYLRGWIERLAKYHPDILQGLGEDLVRQSMLRKLENKCFNSDIFYDEFVIKANQRQMMDFLTDSTKTLADALKEINTEEVIKVTNTKHNTHRLKMAGKSVTSVSYRSKKEAEQVLEVLDKVEKEIQEKKKYLSKILSGDLVESR